MKEKVTNSRGLHYDPLSLNKDRNSSTSKIVQQNSSIAERKQERNYGDEEDEEDVDEDEDSGSVDEDFVYGDDDVANTIDFVDEIINEHEESLVKKFLQASSQQTRTLADIIMEKIKEKEYEEAASAQVTEENHDDIPAKVIEVYTGVGALLQHFKSGKLPKALKMLPHLKNWEKILWITRPDMWSPAGTFVVTRIFASNLNVKMAQRFLNLVLLEKCRDDIRNHNKLNFHLYMALKKSLFKPASFYKGILLPLVQSGDCTLREACIFGSVISKVSIPNIHSAAALLRLLQLPYTGSTSVFVKIILSKKYAFPRRVISSLQTHFCNFIDEDRALPVIWHQSLLCFVQRYKLELEEEEVEGILSLIKKHNHGSISTEIKRELSAGKHISRNQM